MVVDSVEFEKPSTKAFIAVLGALGIRGKALLAMKAPSQAVSKSAGNIPASRWYP